MPEDAGTSYESKTDDYILEVNNRFASWGGSRTIAIPYDISPRDLRIILP